MFKLSSQVCDLRYGSAEIDAAGRHEKFYDKSMGNRFMICGIGFNLPACLVFIRIYPNGKKAVLALGK